MSTAVLIQQLVSRIQGQASGQVDPLRDAMRKAIRGAAGCDRVEPASVEQIAPEVLLSSAGLKAQGPVAWHEPVPTHQPGVYVVEWRSHVAQAPVDSDAVGAWLRDFPNLEMDGTPPTAKQLAARISELWVPNQTIIYIGESVDLGARLEQYYATKLGMRSPHRGGILLKTLLKFERSMVWWSETKSPLDHKRQLLRLFAEKGLGARPFANLQGPGKKLGLKNHAK